MLSLPSSLWLTLTVAFTGLLAQSPEELLRRSDVGAFTPSSFRARLILRRLSLNASHEVEIWRSGNTRTLIRFLDTKDRGKFLLRLKDQLWFIAPGAREPVRMSPSYRLYGGVTVDEVLGVRLAEEYRVERATDEMDAGGKLIVLELRAKSKRMLFPEVRYAVRETTGRPVQALYRLKSGRAATSVEFMEWTETGPTYARRVLVKDLLRKGDRTEVEVLELQERPVPDALFDLRDPTSRRALESAPGKS